MMPTARSIRRSFAAMGLTLLVAIAITQTLASTQQYQPQNATEPNAQAVDPNPKILSVLLYNLQLRPRLLFATAQSDRVQKVAPLLQGYDVIVLAEAFDDYALTQLSQLLAPHYPHQSSPLGENKGLSQDSGLVIFSRWEITGQSQQMFDTQDCAGISCFNDRGAILVSIDKNGQPYHLLTTQLQSGHGRKEKGIRDRQIQQLSLLSSALKLPKEDPVILAASLPISSTLQDLEYQQLKESLNLYSTERSTEQLANQFEHSVDSSQNTLTRSSVAHTPDAFFTLAQHRQPSSATWQVQPIQTSAQQAWNKPFFYWQRPQQNLSDHHAIVGSFEYR